MDVRYNKKATKTNTIEDLLASICSQSIVAEVKDREVQAWSVTAVIVGHLFSSEQ